MNTENHDMVSCKKLALLWLIIGVAGRLIPHLPNMTPVLSMSLFAGNNFSKRVSIVLILGIMFISDVALSYLCGYPILSSWSLFTYSGFALLAFFGSFMPKQVKMPALTAVIFGSSLFFWLWTNLGVWLVSNMFDRSLQGLIICYTAALPFLRNEILGDLIWGIIIFKSFAIIETKAKLRKQKSLAVFCS